MKVKKYFNIEEYRKKYKQAQEIPSKILGIHRTTYSRKVTGEIDFTTDEALLLLTWLNGLAEKSGDPLITFEELFLPNNVSIAQQ